MEENLGEIIRDIKKNYEDDDNFDLATHLIDYYYIHFYNGDEIDKVTLLYFDHVWLELIIWLGQNASYFKQNKKGLKKANRFFDKNLIKAKINTHKGRIYLFRNWINGRENLIYNKLLNRHQKDILSTLLILYPNMSYIQEVKIGLGLNETIEQLENKLKELKNADKI